MFDAEVVSSITSISVSRIDCLYFLQVDGQGNLERNHAPIRIVSVTLRYEARHIFSCIIQ